MPPKRPSPLEHPPSASSTSGEETEDEEVQATDGEEEEEEEVGSEEEEELEQPKPTQPSRPIPKSKPISHQTSVPKPQSSDDNDSDEGSDEEKVDLADDSTSDTENENEPVKHMIAPRNADVKPFSSKPMTEPPKPKKPIPTPTPTSTLSAPKTSSAAKRPLEIEKKDKRERKKKKVADLEDEEETEKKGGEDKKNLIQRIWSEEDEIVLLKGLIDYKKRGFNPFTNNMSGFLDFIKNSLHVENLKNNQLLNKVQRLKQKYQNNAGRAKPGEEPVISRPHELNSYQLSKQIWGEQSEGVEANHIGSESVKSDVKKSKNQVSSNGVASSPKRKISKVAANSPKVVAENPKVAADPPKVVTSSQKVDRKQEDTRSGPEFLFLNGSVQSHSIPLMPVPPQGLGEIFAKKGWDSIKGLNAGKLDQRWKAMLIAETQVYLDRLDLVRDQTKGMLDALMSSDF